MNMRIEAMTLPVSDVDRAKAFYAMLGWRLDIDLAAGDAFRVIQFTPPGSDCSILFGKGITAAAPGSVQNVRLVVTDVEAARAELVGRGATVSDVFHIVPGQGPVGGLDPQRRSYQSYAELRDPDGNTWLLQEITQRLPGR